MKLMTLALLQHTAVPSMVRKEDTLSRAARVLDIEVKIQQGARPALRLPPSTWAYFPSCTEPAAGGQAGRRVGV